MSSVPEAGLLELARRGPVHFVGIAGAGMAGLALVLQKRGAQVTGCDREASPALEDLRAAGLRVLVGHDPAHVQGSAALVATAAVPQDHPELERARRLGVPVRKRARALGEIVNAGRLIAVAGTHGKTTTTAMAAQVLRALGLEPTALVGGRLAEWRGNALLGGDEHYVVEADEYDRSFLELRPHLAVVTSVEPEHLDCYRDRADIENAFVRFARPASSKLGIIACADDEGATRVAKAASEGEALLYGLGPRAVLRADNLSLSGGGSAFDARWGTRPLGRFELNVPGEHNVRNALAALAVALRSPREGRQGRGGPGGPGGPGGREGLGQQDVDVAREALAAFQGVDRRFQILGEAAGVLVVDDYAHHPTELAATIRAVRQGWPERRVLVVFQPHLYSRTRDFAQEFGRALASADRAWVLEIYAARESPIPGVGGEVLVEHARRAGAGPGQVTFGGSLGEAVTRVLEAAQPGDVCLVLGAGDVWKAARDIHARLTERAHVAHE